MDEVSKGEVRDGEESSGLSGGAIAGIVVGCVVGVALIAAVVVTASKKKVSETV